MRPVIFIEEKVSIYRLFFGAKAPDDNKAIRRFRGEDQDLRKGNSLR